MISSWCWAVTIQLNWRGCQDTVIMSWFLGKTTRLEKQTVWVRGILSHFIGPGRRHWLSWGLTLRLVHIDRGTVAVNYYLCISLSCALMVFFCSCVNWMLLARTNSTVELLCNDLCVLHIHYLPVVDAKAASFPPGLRTSWCLKSEEF